MVQDISMLEISDEEEDLLKRELETSTLRCLGQSEGGHVSDARTFLTDNGKVFAKINRNQQARQMFEGEAASLEALKALQVVKVPTPIKVISLPKGGAVFVMENLEIVSGLSQHAALLGEKIAMLHLKNAETDQSQSRSAQSIHKRKSAAAVEKFGFHVPVYDGNLPQDNTWTDTWPEFITRKMEQQVSHYEQVEGDRTVRVLWSQALPKVSRLFHGLEIRPSLLHGDLWDGNVAEDSYGPVMFDPASFYGHWEYDLSMASLYGCLGPAFAQSYFTINPRGPGYEDRLKFYHAFHCLKHWNYFREPDKGLSITETLENLVKTVHQ